MTSLAAEPPQLAQPTSAKSTHLAGFVIICFLLRMFFLTTAGWQTADEAWILQIVHRLQSGQTLYKDVFFNCTPLSIYLARAACALLGTSALTLKALVAAIECGTFLTLRQILHSLDPASAWKRPAKSALLLILLLPVPSPFLAHLYNELATLLILLATLVFLRPRTTLSSAVLGIMVGLTIMEKQNLGIYLVAATFAALIIAHARLKSRMIHRSITAVGAFVTVAILLAPIYFNGAWGPFFTDAFLMKSQYLHAGAISFFDGFQDLTGTFSTFDPANTAAHLLFPLAFVAAFALLASLHRPAVRRITPFLLVIAAGIFPRADAWHLATAYPAMLLILCLTVSAWSRPIAAQTARITALAAIFTLLSMLAFVFTRISSGNYILSTLPFARGILMHKNEQARLTRLATTIAALPQPVLILSPDAGTLHLLASTVNPVPYDYIIASELPPGSQQHIQTDIDAGRIRTILLLPRPHWFAPQFIPDPLQRDLESRTHSAAILEDFQVFTPGLPATPPN